MHGTFKLGDDLFMACDLQPEHYEKPAGFHVALAVDSPAEAERVFEALAVNGEVTMPLAETFWAPRFGMLIDQFGIPWMINCNPAG